MNVIRVFPDRNKWTPDDEMAFVGEPPLFRPGTPETPVMVSATFTWWRRRAEQIADSWRMYYQNVRVGGPAYDDPGGEFVPGMFMKTGCTITTRGCPKKCGWCKVPFSEGAQRLLKTIQPMSAEEIISDDELLRIFDGMYSQGDADVRCYSAKVVRPRLSKKCPGNFAEALHDVPAKTRGVVERAIIDGEWRSCYTCESCIVAFAKESGRIERAPAERQEP